MSATKAGSGDATVPLTATGSGTCSRCHVPIADGARFCSTCGSDQQTPNAPHPGNTAAMAFALEDLVSRTLAGRYTVRRLLGAGGMASVFLADDLTLERTVAIKVLPTDMAHDENLVARFQREAKTAAKLDHPHIIPIYRVESEASLNYFVMKYVEGRSLDRVVRTSERQPLEFVQRVLAEAGSALGHAHRKGVVHRDVKPANIMLDAEDRVILTDFGISKVAESTSQLTQTGVIVGTPYYMSPEQVLSRDIDGRADQYALAVLAFQMLTGELPFVSENAHAVLYQQIHEAPPRVRSVRPDVPAYIDDAIDRALAKKPEDRFATMEEFVQALTGETLAPSRSITAATTKIATLPGAIGARTAPTHRASARRASHGAPWWAVGVVVAIAAGALGAWRLTVRPGVPQAPTVAVSPPSLPAAATTDSMSAAASASAPAAASPDTAAPPPPRSTPTVARAERRVAYLTVASEPYGTLYIDGVDAGVTPRADYPLTVGKKYEIRVEQVGYRTQRETIAVTGPNPIRRHYVLDAVGSP